MAERGAAATAARGSLVRGLKALRRVGPARLAGTAIFILLALLLARFSWELPLALEAERALYDLRVINTAPKTDPDPRIVQVVYTDDTLIATEQRSPLDRTTLAQALTALDAMGAKAIGIDILIDQPQADDQLLVDAFRAMRTPTFLAYADELTNAETMQFNQREFLDSFHARIRTETVRPTSIRIEPDGDNVHRSWPRQPASLPALLAVALSGQPDWREHSGAVRWRLPNEAERPVFDAFPIELFANPETRDAFAAQIRGRYVLIGGHILAQDEKETPLRILTGQPIYGLEFHAHLLAQLLDGARSPPVPDWGLWGIAIAVVVAGGLSSLIGGAWIKLALMFGGQAAFFGYFPFYLQSRGVDTLGLPAFGWAVGWFVAFAAVGAAARAFGADQRKFAQGALGKYLPRDIANQIMADPERLSLSGEKREIFVVFTDLEGFTKLSHAISAETTASLLNRYLDMLSDVVLDYGGTIDKFVGDAVVAFWGAPIARPDDGERAARAAYALWEAGEEFRKTAPEGLPPIGRTRVGLHWGDAVVGNFGGEGRIQYTALGDAMNCAARLEAANKQLGSSVIASREAAERSGLDWWRPLGRIVLRGRAKPVDIFEPVPKTGASDLGHFRAILERVNEGHKDAVTDLKALASSNPDDTALGNLVQRVERTEAGGSYVLD